MARTAQSYNCKHCGASGLYWTRVQGPRGISVRLAHPVTGVHRCKEYEQARERGEVLPARETPIAPPFEPKPFNAPKPVSMPVSQPEASQEVSEPKQTEAYDDTWIKPYVNQQDSIVTSHIVDAIGKLQAQITDLDRKREVVVIIEKPNCEAVTITGAHKCFPELLKLVSLRLNALLVGPAGSGKTKAAHMVADALGLAYYPMSVGPQTSKSDLLGYTDAHGKLVRTVLREAFEHGGLFLLDEVDAGNPGVLTILNALLANDKCSFPDGVIEKHADFICVAAGNTYGQGANRQYVGRQQLDAATLDRFVGIEWVYDEALEMRLCGAQSDWCEYVWNLRRAADKHGIRRVFGTRRIQQGAALLNAGMCLDEVKAKTVFFGCSEDDRRKLEASI